MCQLDQLLENNRRWAEHMQRENPEYFPELARDQRPRYLWIGCADSRVPPNEIVGLAPGELFVHRNIANMVVHTDLNVLSVLEYAVDVLRVPHIIVCGHENCGGVRAATMHQSFGIVDNWLLEIKDIYEANRRELESKRDEAERLDLLARFNTVQQVMSLCATTIVQRAWHRAQSLSVHGVFFRLRDGVLEDLEMNINGPDALPESHRLTSSRRV